MRRRIPGVLIALSADLLDPTARQTLRDSFGYKWIRPAVRPWQETLRNPILGGLFELTQYEVPGAVPLLSCVADHAIRKLCY